MFVNPYVANPQLLRVVEKQIDFINPHKSELTISPQDVSLSGYQVEQSRTIDQRLQLLNRQVRRQGTVIVNNGNALGDVQQVITSGGTADTQRYDQINFHLKNLQTAVDDLPQKYVSIEDYNKLKKQLKNYSRKVVIIVAIDYRDESGFSQANHSMAEIAEAIRHKKYGRDVREAMVLKPMIE